MVHIEEATADDAAAMSAILTEILVSWGSPRPRSAQHVFEFYIEHPNTIRCSVAKDEVGQVVGFQSLKIAGEGNPYDLPAEWGVIGTYVDIGAGRIGIGKALFSSSLEAALSTELSRIDATIGDTNRVALNYYDSMGFKTYKTKPGAVCKQFIVR